MTKPFSIIVITMLFSSLAFGQTFSFETGAIIEAILNSDTVKHVVNYETLNDATIIIAENEFTPDTMDISVPELQVMIISKEQIEKRNIEQFFEFANAKVKEDDALMKFIYCTDDVPYRVLLKKKAGAWHIIDFKAKDKY